VSPPAILHPASHSATSRARAKFLIRATYTADGARGLMKDGGSGRKAAVDKAISGMGGKLESFYFALSRGLPASEAS
jgi:uncharacterized protein with GYD domain